jgi:hypothetical protein
MRRLLDRALARNGHTSVVIAMEGSHIEGRLPATPRAGGPLDDAARAAAHAWHRDRIAQALPSDRFDCIHMHAFDFHRYLPAAGPPLALGRIFPEKGFHLALDAAKESGAPLLVAGDVFRYREHEEYFRRELLPRCNGRTLRFIGPVRTGFLVNDAHEMARAIRDVDAIDPLRCREAARERFPADRMTEQYLNCDQRLAEAGAQNMGACADRAS